jgi:acyl carrier protein
MTPLSPELLPIRKDTKLIESGILDSLTMLKLVTFLEEKFGVKVDPEDVVRENFETVAMILNFMDEKRRTSGVRQSPG